MNSDLHYWLVSIDIRHGDYVTTRKHVVVSPSKAEAEREALETEAMNVGDDLDSLDEQDGGFYSRTWELHFSRIEATEIPKHNGITLKHYLR